MRKHAYLRQLHHLKLHGTEYVTLALPNYLHCDYSNNSYNLKVLTLKAKNVISIFSQSTRKAAISIFAKNIHSSDIRRLFLMKEH